MTIRWSDETRQPASPTLLLTVEETARQLHIARRRVFEKIRSGEIPSVKIGKSRRIRSTDLAEYVAGLGGGDVPAA